MKEKKRVKTAKSLVLIPQFKSQINDPNKKKYTRKSKHKEVWYLRVFRSAIRFIIAFVNIFLIFPLVHYFFKGYIPPLTFAIVLSILSCTAYLILKPCFEGKKNGNE